MFEHFAFEDNYFRNVFVQLLSQSADALEDDALEIKGWCKDEHQLTEKIADAASCLANAQGGVVLVGIEDGTGPRRFTPCPFPNVSSSWLVARVQDNTHPPVSCRALDVSADLADVRGVADAHAFALLVDRKKCLSGHMTSKGICRARHGKECKPVFLSDDDRTSVVVAGATVDELAVGTINWAAGQHNRHFRAAESFADAEDFLSRAGLLLDADSDPAERVTLAAMLLFGKESALSKHGVSCETVIKLPGTHKTLRKNIIESLRELVLGENSFLRHACPTVPEASMRELLVNAYAHRCWRTNGPVSITLSDTMLEIQNPGDLLPGLSVGILLYGVPAYRNLSLAEGLRFGGFSDKIGQGIDIVFKTVLSGGFDFPVFESSNNLFQVSIPLARSEEFKDYVNRRGATLSQLDELVVLRYLWAVGESDFKKLAEVLQHGREIARRIVDAMQKKLMIEVVGGAFRLSETLRLDIEKSRNSDQMTLDLYGES